MCSDFIVRIWTLHPRYLDARGLVALWREGLLAQQVLLGHTRGYRHHPQLTRFRAMRNPVAALATYLATVQEEASHRGYAFDATRLVTARTRLRIEETEGQLLYEWQHLRAKLRRRSPLWYRPWRAVLAPEAHPLFAITPGPVRDWERV